MSQNQGWQPPSVPPPSPAPPPTGWGHGWSGAGWVPPPDVKPGVVALRPLGVGELLDGAVATLRQNPGPMLGLSAVVAVITQLVQLAASWLVVRDTSVALEGLSETADFTTVASTISGGLTVALFAVVIAWVATILLTGILTIVVSRAVLGQRMSAGEAWRAARPRLLRLLGLTLLVALIVSAPVLVVVALCLVLWAAGTPAAAVAVAAVVLGIAAVVLGVWLYVRYAVATPALMLETTTDPMGGSRPATMMGALRRSAVLVRGAWWRTFGILLLAFVIATVVSQVVAVPAALPLLLEGPFVNPDGSPTLLFFIIQGVAGVVATTLTAPFTAALTVLLYVDRRIRREGLDIELARAAGVSIPGRTDVPRPAP
jgi:hypothetical protein